MLYDDMPPSSIIVIFQLLRYSADRLKLNVELYISRHLIDGKFDIFIDSNGNVCYILLSHKQHYGVM